MYFLKHYKDGEPGKFINVDNKFYDKEHALKLINLYTNSNWFIVFSLFFFTYYLLMVNLECFHNNSWCSFIPLVKSKNVPSISDSPLEFSSIDELPSIVYGKANINNNGSFNKWTFVNISVENIRISST